MRYTIYLCDVPLNPKNGYFSLLFSSIFFLLLKLGNWLPHKSHSHTFPPLVNFSAIKFTALAQVRSKPPRRRYRSRPRWPCRTVMQHYMLGVYDIDSLLRNNCSGWPSLMYICTKWQRGQFSICMRWIQVCCVKIRFS